MIVVDKRKLGNQFCKRDSRLTSGSRLVLQLWKPPLEVQPGARFLNRALSQMTTVLVFGPWEKLKHLPKGD